MMRNGTAKGVAVALAAAVMLASATTVNAAVKKVATTVQVAGVEVNGDNGLRWEVFGNVKSGVAKCRAGRKLTLVKVGGSVLESYKPSASRFVLTIDYQSNLQTADYEVRAAKKVVGKRKRRRICKPDFAVVSFERSPDDVNVTGAYGPPGTFSGSVASADSRCVRFALVFGRNGDQLEFLGGAPTHAGGSWTYTHSGPVAPGTYVAAQTGTYYGSPRSGGNFRHVLCRDGISTDIVAG